MAGRATFVDRAPRVYAYVHKQVSSAAARLDQFLRQSGVRPDERVTVISDDAGEFEKAVAGSRLARGRILDWFQIAMKFQAAERSVRGNKSVDLTQRDAVEQALQSAKWLVWHGKGGKDVARIKALDAALMASDSHEDSTLWWNLRRLYFYLANNAGTLVTTVHAIAKACRSAAASQSPPSTRSSAFAWRRSSRCARPMRELTAWFR